MCLHVCVFAIQEGDKDQPEVMELQGNMTQVHGVEEEHSREIQENSIQEKKQDIVHETVEVKEVDGTETRCQVKSKNRQKKIVVEEEFQADIQEDENSEEMELQNSSSAGDYDDDVADEEPEPKNSSEEMLADVDESVIPVVYMCGQFVSSTTKQIN